MCMWAFEFWRICVGVCLCVAFVCGRFCIRTFVCLSVYKCRCLCLRVFLCLGVFFVFGHFCVFGRFCGFYMCVVFLCGVCVCIGFVYVGVCV